MAKTHKLKIEPLYFDMKLAGMKNWELRTDDRGFKIGDILHLREWHMKQYTGRFLKTEILYIYEIQESIIPEKHVILSDDIIEGCSMYTVKYLSILPF